MTEICLSGTGGQGLILAGIILAEAAVLDGNEAIQTQSYGPEARGGASKADVIISRRQIDYPKVLAADMVLAMSQEACNKYVEMLKENGKLIVDTTFVKAVPQVAAQIYPLEITATAKETFGNAVFANIIALGVLTGLSNLVTRDSLSKAVLARVPKGTEDRNRQALEIGWSLALELQKS
jgi:2-oxoglutarate ferredoxin oxidoreductase subunit gamma